MTLGEAIIIAKEMQKWRRSEPPYDGETPAPMPYTPQEFGEAIDLLIDLGEREAEMMDSMNRFKALLKKEAEK